MTEVFDSVLGRRRRCVVMLWLFRSGRRSQWDLGCCCMERKNIQKDVKRETWRKIFHTTGPEEDKVCGLFVWLIRSQVSTFCAKAQSYTVSYIKCIHPLLQFAAHLHLTFRLMAQPPFLALLAPHLECWPSKDYSSSNSIFAFTYGQIFWLTSCHRSLLLPVLLPHTKLAQSVLRDFNAALPVLMEPSG